MMLRAALKALNMGFHIFPVRAGDKIPHPMAGQWGETATNDPNQVIRFWTQVDPNANIGVACKPSNLLVVDLDRAKKDWALKDTEWGYVHAAFGPSVDGEDLFDEMKFKLSDDDQDPYETHVVQTGSGGVHLYYRWPASWPRISQASPAKGVVDVRGNGGQYGGYVLADGSRTAAGPYAAYAPAHEIALPPVWIRKLVVEKPPVQKIRRPQGLRQPGAISHSGLVDSVRNAGEGNRNNALLWAARTMCEENATENECLATLGPAASAAGLGDFEIQRTIQSAYRVQRQKEGR
jgi:bifunctional DNA primase/polymerase-like protein/primase-like protein